MQSICNEYERFTKKKNNNENFDLTKCSTLCFSNINKNDKLIALINY